MSNKAQITVFNEEPIGVVSPLVHGHFAQHLGRCCYDGLWVGPDSKIPNIDGFRTDLVDAFRQVGIPPPPPGGCFAVASRPVDVAGSVLTITLPPCSVSTLALK